LAAADASGFDAIVALLAEAGLPTRDLTPASLADFVAASDGVRVIGAVAMERYGHVGLVRSLVVAPAYRGKGVGAALVDAIEEGARTQGIGRVALLTETAQPFFEQRGYVAVPRASAPATVRGSSEIALLCIGTGNSARSYAIPQMRQSRRRRTRRPIALIH
jgi:amino-acid N-acetyltransferase